MGTAAPVLMGIAVLICQIPVGVGAITGMAVTPRDRQDDKDGKNPAGMTHLPPPVMVRDERAWYGKVQGAVYLGCLKSCPGNIWKS